MQGQKLSGCNVELLVWADAGDTNETVVPHPVVAGLTGATPGTLLVEPTTVYAGHTKFFYATQQVSRTGLFVFSDLLIEAQNDRLYVLNFTLLNPLGQALYSPSQGTTFSILSKNITVEPCAENQFAVPYTMECRQCPRSRAAFFGSSRVQGVGGRHAAERLTAVGGGDPLLGLLLTTRHQCPPPPQPI